MRIPTKLCNFWCFAIPLILGLTYGPDVLSLTEQNAHLFKIAIGIAVMQVLIALWAVFSRWDDNLACSARASSDAYEMERAWKALGKGHVGDIAAEFSLRSKQQDVIDARDIGQDLSDRERNLGRRSGLIEYRRKCVEWLAKPESGGPPLFPKKMPRVWWHLRRASNERRVAEDHQGFYQTGVEGPGGVQEASQDGSIENNQRKR